MRGIYSSLTKIRHKEFISSFEKLKVKKHPQLKNNFQTTELNKPLSDN